MVMNKKGADLMTIIVPLIVVIVIAIIIIGFNQGSIGRVSSVLGANDAVVISAATGCNPSVSVGSPDLQKKFCYEFKTIEKKSFLGFSTQFVNCDYLNNTIKTTITGVDAYKATTCPATVWEEQCKLRVSENQDSSDYSVLINGKECSAKELALIAGKDPLEEDRYNVTNNCALVARGTYVVDVNAVEILFKTLDECKAKLSKPAP